MNRALINAAYSDPEFVEKFHQGIVDRMEMSEGEARIVSTAFPVVVLPNVFPDSIMKSVKLELLKEQFYQKHNDLYSFLQSDDLKNTNQRGLKELYEHLKGREFVQWISSMTGIELMDDKMDFAAQIYSQGDRLLCHDDDIKSDSVGRRIAFILYLVDEDWNDECGGHLDIYSLCDHGKCPKDVVSSVLPRWNTLALFEVTPTSFHAVREVLAADKQRLSITGWFYGPVPKQYIDRDTHCSSIVSTNALFSPLLNTTDSDQSEIERWINPEYLKPDYVSRISNVFLEESHVELYKFLRKGVIEAINSELDQQLRSKNAIRMGPVSHCSYTQVSPSEASVLFELQRFISSTEFARYLHQLTGLELTQSQSEYRHFSPGSYTLMSDDTLERAPALDLYLSFSPMKRPEETGGSMVYVADEDTLLQVAPGENKLTIVYRDEGVMRFVDYLTHQNPAVRTELAAIFIE